MKKFEVVCIDMFQTLVNIYSRRSYIWKRILGDQYSLDLEEAYAKLVDKKIYEKFHIHVDKATDFVNLKSIFRNYFFEIFEENNLPYNAESAAEAIISEHGLASPYHDTQQFLDIVGKSLPICLVSDADTDMILPLLEQFKFDKVFISEEIKAYKKDHENKMFKKVIGHYGINPEKIIHIGDASSDIIGANNAGIVTCWINRHDHKWNHKVEPHYKVKTLLEILPILELSEKDSGVKEDKECVCSV